MGLGCSNKEPQSFTGLTSRRFVCHSWEVQYESGDCQGQLFLRSDSVPSGDAAIFILGHSTSQGHTEVPPAPCPLVGTGHLALLSVGGLGSLGFLRDTRQAEGPVPHVGRASQLVSGARFSEMICRCFLKTWRVRLLVTRLLLKNLVFIRRKIIITNPLLKICSSVVGAASGAFQQ